MRTRILFTAVFLIMLPTAVSAEHYRFATTSGSSSGGRGPTTSSVGSVPLTSQLVLRDPGWLNGNRSVRGKSSQGSRSGHGGIQFQLYGDVRLAGSGVLVEHGAFNAFCVDLRDRLASDGRVTVRSASGRSQSVEGVIYEAKLLQQGPNGRSMSLARLQAFGELWGRYYQRLFAGTTSGRRLRTEAFMLAMWELTYEDVGASQLDRSKVARLDVRRGPGFSVDLRSPSGMSDVTKLANSWLRSLNGMGPRWTMYSLVPKGGQSRYQDLVFGVVPEPTTVMYLASLGLMGGLGLVWRRRRRGA